MNKTKFKITADVSANKAVIRIDGRISDWNNHAMGFKAKLDEIISQGITDAKIYINSPGGNCFEGNEIANELIRFKGTTTAHLGALCASAVSYIACKCTKVIAAKNVAYMIHKPITYFEGNSDQVKAELKLLENLQQEYAESYAKKTGLSVEKINSMWTEDYWMNSEEAKRLGFIDEIEEDSEITDEDVQAIRAYKSAPSIEATAKPQNLNNNQMKQLLITALALVATASDNEVLAHVDALKVKAARTDEAERKLAALESATKKEKVDAAISRHTANKKITDATKSFWEKQLNADFDSANATLDAMAAPIKLTAAISGGGKDTTDRSQWSYQDYLDKDPEALKKLSKDSPSEFEALATKHYGSHF